MLKSVLLSTAALALIATAADANPNVMISKDNRYVSTMPTGAKSKMPPFVAPGGKWVYSTFNKDKEGAYFCCYGSSISGPSSFLGKAYGVAEQFTLSSAASISTLGAGVGYVSGTKNVTLTLYADNGSNSPGTMLAQGSGTASTGFGYCCGIVTASISSTSLSANTPYWVGITAGGADYDAAGFQVKDEVDGNVYVAGTSNGGTSWGAGTSETEYNPSIGVK